MAEAASHLQPLIRPAVDGDRNFIAATWSQSFWKESPWGSRVRWSIFAPGQRIVIDRVLSRARVLVACEPSAPDEILGYLVTEDATPERPAALVWSYVKPAFRHAGIFGTLLAISGLPPDLAGCEVVQCTRAWFSAPPLLDKATRTQLKPGRAGLEEKFPLAVHNPFRAFEP